MIICGAQVRIKDYISEPKDDGYRAVHVIVKYDDRRIEVQLRTRIQHEWAFTVEGVTSRFGLDVKAGGGPPEVREWFAAVSEAMPEGTSGQRQSHNSVVSVARISAAVGVTR